jgi:hypothetical protein
MEGQSLAKRFGAAARCNHATSQQKAHQLWSALSEKLHGDTRWKIRIAWDHATMGEGPAELDALVQELVDRGL